MRNVLVDYRREAEGSERSGCWRSGTSAARDADNGEAFLGEIEWSYGFTTRLLDGGEEAELMLRGVASDQLLDTGTLVIDIGGGSTELAMAGRGRARLGDQHRGGQRAPDRAVPPSDPPIQEELEACAGTSASLLPDMRGRGRRSESPER